MSFSPLRKRNGIIGLALLLIIGASAGFYFSRNTIDRTLISENITLTRVTLNSQPTTNAYITVPFRRETNKYTFMNIAADWNNDGRIADYVVNGVTQQEGIVKNLGIKARAEQRNSFSFALPDTSVEQKNTIRVTVMATSATLDSWDGTIQKPSAARVLTVTSFTTDEITRFSHLIRKES